MKINCPACGHSIELSEAYDDYEGPIRCWVCRAVFEVRIEDGCVKAARTRELTASPPPH
jgi:transcription elongation factor Elf1